MTTDKIKTPVGTVEIKIYEGDKLVNTVNKKNALTANALDAVVRALGGADWHIDQVQVLNLSVPLATVGVSVSYDTGLAIFTAVFDESSFNGVFDELNLCISFNTSIFSILNSLNITKTNLQKIAISWKISMI